MSQENILDELVQNLSSNSWNELLSACFDRGISQNTVLNYMADRNSICLLEASMDFEATAPAEISEALDSDSLFFTLQPSQTPDTLTPDTLTTPNDGLDDYFFSYANDDNDTFDLTNFSDQTNQQANQPTNQPTSQQTKQQDSQPNSLFSSQTTQNSVPTTIPDDGLEDFFCNDNDNDNDNNLLSNFLSDDFLSASTNQQLNQQNSMSEFLSEDDIRMYFGGESESECTCVFWPEMSKQPTCDHCDFVAIRKEREEENKRKKIAEKKVKIQNFATSVFARPVRLQFFFDDE